MIPSNSAPNDRPILAWLRLLSVALAAASFALVLRSGGQIFATPLTEDGYYSLAVARSLARGLGLTIDGVHETNGFQPLFTFIEAFCYWLAAHLPHPGEITAMRLVLLVSWLCYVGTALVLGNIAANLDEPRHAPLRKNLAITLYLGAFLAFMHHFNGLETGLLMFLLALTWRAHQLALATHGLGRMVIGILLGLLILTRIDAAIFVVCYGVARVIFAGAMLSAHQRKRRFGQRLLETAQIALVTAVIIAPWFLYNYQHFGNIMPSSGQAQILFGIDERRLRWMVWAIGAAIIPNLWLGVFDEIYHNGLVLSIARGVLIFFGLIFFARMLRYRGGTIYRAQARFGVEFGLILLVALLILAGFYALSFVSFWFYYRYIFPFALLSVVSMAWMLATFARRQRFLAGFVIFALATPTLLSAIMAQNGRTLHVDTVYWPQITLVRQNVPERVKVAAGQTGTLGYFRPNVVNLDGKVNRDALPFQDHMGDYLQQNEIEWFCDWPNYAERYLGPNPKQNGWILVDEARNQDGLIWQLWRHSPPDANPSEK